MMTFGSLFRNDGEFGATLEVPEDKLKSLCARAAATVEFDEIWYLRTYPDVSEAVKRGRLKSAREHYVTDGYFEDRMPRLIEVDEKWYLAEYPDVADAIRRGLVDSAQAHFASYGFKEGRLPYDGWSL